MNTDEVAERNDGAEEESGRDWSQLPADMVRLCASRLDCNVDPMNMSFQCTAWRAALGRTVRDIQLPWMLIPYRRTCLLQPDILRCAHFFCFLSKRLEWLRYLGRQLIHLLALYAQHFSHLSCLAHSWHFLGLVHLFSHVSVYWVIFLLFDQLRGHSCMHSRIQ